MKTARVNILKVLIVVGSVVIFSSLMIVLLSKILSEGVVDLPTRNGKIVENPSYQIDVLNACGVEDVAFQITQYLRIKGFDVIDYGNYDRIVNESFIIDRVGKPDTAKLIAKTLGIRENKIIRSRSIYYNEFTVVVGKDYIALKPFKNKNEVDF